jgi:putative methionine-R-sulfoxide reductase with GAF domain
VNAARADEHRGALAAIDRILNREPEADEVLRQAVQAVQERIAGYRSVALYFVESGDLSPGPRSGRDEPDEPGAALLSEAVASGGLLAGDGRIAVPVPYEGRVVAAISITTDSAAKVDAAERAFLQRVALVISAHCLVGWDTGGVVWAP